MTYARDLSKPRYEDVREWRGEHPQLTVRARVQDDGGLRLEVDTTAGIEMIRVEQVDFAGAAGEVASFFPADAGGPGAPDDQDAGGESGASGESEGRGRSGRGEQKLGYPERGVDVLPGGVEALVFTSATQIPAVVTSAMVRLSYTDRPLLPLFPAQ